MSTALKLSKYLGFDEFKLTSDKSDPGNEDISFLIKVTRFIPKQPEDIAKVDAKVLATYCLGAYQLSSELYSKAYLWYGMRKVDLEYTLGKLISESSKAATVAEKSAKASDDYKNAANLVYLGDAYVKFYLGLMKNFETGHYWARDKEKQESREGGLSHYEPALVRDISGRNVGDEPPTGEVNLGD